MDNPEVAAAIARSFIGRLPAGLMDELLAAGERIDIPAGSTIYRPGDSPRALLVVRGLLRVYMASPEGRQVTVRYTRSGDVLGIAVLVGGPANVGVQALDHSRLFRIDSRVLIAAARRDASVAWALAEDLNRRLYDTLEQTAINAFGSVRQRVASHLLDLASAQQRPLGELVAQVSQQELADAVGSVREVVARVLRDLRVAGLVTTAADSVRILDAATLHAECWS
ncbi:MAG TPA: Crp/Fnr family transcriptional regulator [Jatrophihabitantaceae bacterium]|jgi:CRP/FNR family transcriptional regulator